MRGAWKWNTSALACCIYQAEQSYHSKILSTYNHRLMLHALGFGGNRRIGCGVKRHCSEYKSFHPVIDYFSRQILQPHIPTFCDQSGWYFVFKLLLLRASYAANFTLTTLFVWLLQVSRHRIVWESIHYSRTLKKYIQVMIKENLIDAKATWQHGTH